MADVSTSVRELTERYWTWRLQQYPEFATVIGCHDYDDQLDSHSFEAYQNRKRDCEQFLELTNRYLSEPTLNEENCVNLTILKKELETYIFGVDSKGFYCPISSYEDILTNFEKTVKYMPFKLTRDYENLITRFQKFPAKMDGIISVLRLGIGEGRTQHYYSVKDIMHSISHFIHMDPRTTLLYKPFQILEQLQDISTDRKTELQETGATLIRTHIQDTFKKFIHFLNEEYLQNLRPGLGLSTISNGRENYEAILKFYTSSDLTPEEIHQMGLQEVQRIRSEMNQIVKRVGFEGDLEDFFHFLETDKKFYYNTEKEIIDGYKDTLQIIRKELPKYFKHIPSVELRIVNTAWGKASARATAYYEAPSMDGTKPGILEINSVSQYDKPKFEVLATTLHEAEPGHHLQFSYCTELTHLPAFRRFKDDRYYARVPSSFPMHSAYIEGWAMYCERLGEEMGLYKDPYSLFGRYCMELERACRLVVDTGIHAFGWDIEDTVKYLRKNTTISDERARRYIERFVRVPGQACSYTLGKIKFENLRQEAENKLGENFDMKDFHDMLLSSGPLPLTVLELLVDKFIESRLPTQL